MQKNVDRRVKERSGKSGARAWYLKSPLKELRKKEFEREFPKTRERNTASPYLPITLKQVYGHS